MKMPSFLSMAKVPQKKTSSAEADVDKVVDLPTAPRFNLQQIKADFQTLDPKDPGLWPTVPRVVILLGLIVVLIGLAWWLGWDAQLEELHKKQAEEEKLRAEWLDKKKQAVNLPSYRAQLGEIETSFAVLLEQLPNQSEIGELLVDVNKVAQSNGLAIDLFRPIPEVKKDFYAEIPISVQLTGNYHDFGSFAGEVATLPRIVTLNNLELSVTKTDNLVMKGIVKTFRYLSETEVASQKKNEKGAKGAKGAKDPKEPKGGAKS